MNPSPWNSLEVVKLITGLLIPVSLAVLGVYIHRVTKRFEYILWRNQKLIEARLAVYHDLAPLLNDLLCYFTYIGSWKELDPPAVVAQKRIVDKKIHLAAPLFSESFFSACTNFQNLCFETYSGWGCDAKLRTRFQRRQQAHADKWKTEWNDYFSEIVSEPELIKAAYHDVMKAFASDIEVHTSVAPPSGRVPLNII